MPLACKLYRELRSNTQKKDDDILYGDWDDIYVRFLSK